MSSTTTKQQDNLFKIYLLSQDEPEEKENPEERPAEKTSSWKYERYTPKRASFHTMSGKVKRYLA